MKFKNLNLYFIISLLIILIIGISCSSKQENTFEPRDPMPLDEIEYSFIHMDEYLPTKTVHKADQPFIFPRKENIELPEEFLHNGNSYNTQHFIDSSDTQGFLVIQDDTIIYEN